MLDVFHVLTIVTSIRSGFTAIVTRKVITYTFITTVTLLKSCEQVDKQIICKALFTTAGVQSAPHYIECMFFTFEFGKKHHRYGNEYNKDVFKRYK